MAEHRGAFAVLTEALRRAERRPAQRRRATRRQGRVGRVSLDDDTRQMCAEECADLGRHCRWAELPFLAVVRAPRVPVVMAWAFVEQSARLGHVPALPLAKPERSTPGDSR